MKNFILLLFLIWCSATVAQTQKKYLAKVSIDGKYGFIDPSGHEVIPVIYDDAGAWGNNLVPVNIGKIIPKKEAPSIEVPGPSEIQTSSDESNTEKIVSVEIKDEKGKWGYCDSSGALVIPTQFTNTTFFNEGMAGVEIDGKWGFINKQGKIVIQPVYDTIGYFSQGFASVAKNGLHGYINPKGEEVIKLQYTAAEAFENGYALVYEKYASKYNNKKDIGRLINLKGEMVTDAKYSIDLVFSNSLASFSLADAKQEDARYGLINVKGQVVAPPAYFEILDFNNGLARVMVYKRDKIYNEYTPNFGYIDAKGKEIVKPVYTKAESFCYGKAVIARFDDKDDGELDHALINTKGEFLLGFHWKQLILLDSQHLLASSKNKNETSIINTQGKKVISFGDNGLATLGNELSVVTNINDEPIAFIGTNKKISVDLSKNKRKKFISYQLGLIRFQNLSDSYDKSPDIKLGLLDTKGKVISEPKYDRISDFLPID